MTTTGDHTEILRALLTAMVALNDLPHPRYAGRLLLATALVGNGCSDDAVARTAAIPIGEVQEIIPSMLDRCLHIPALLTAKANRTPAGTRYTGIQLTDEGHRQVLLIVNSISA